MREALQRIQELLDSGTPFVVVTLVDEKGSTPQDAGSRMLVINSGRHWGTLEAGGLKPRH